MLKYFVTAVVMPIKTSNPHELYYSFACNYALLAINQLFESKSHILIIYDYLKLFYETIAIKITKKCYLSYLNISTKFCDFNLSFRGI